MLMLSSFVFGGGGLSSDLENPNDPAYLNVFILSLPSFVWFEIPAPTSSRRIEMTCQVIGKRHMLVMGGSRLTTEQQPSVLGISDPWKNRLGIFDMTELVWKFDYNASAAPYERPQVIQDYYQNKWDNPLLNCPPPWTSR